MSLHTLLVFCSVNDPASTGYKCSIHSLDPSLCLLLVCLNSLESATSMDSKGKCCDRYNMSGLKPCKIIELKKSCELTINISVLRQYVLNWFDLCRFENDIKYMIGSKPGWYWKITWGFLAPVVVSVIIVTSVVNLGMQPVKYSVWNPAKVSNYLPDDQ